MRGLHAIDRGARPASFLAGPLLLLAVLVTPARAHPGNGIAVAPDGRIYFADVHRETIWTVDPAGVLAPFVTNRWTHSLMLAPDGTLFYEREEPGEGVAPCSFWKISPDNWQTRLIAPERDRRRFAGGDFVVDVAGNVYYGHNERHADGGWRTRLMRRTPAGEISVFSGAGNGPLFTDGPPGTATIRIITAMAVDPRGGFVFADRDHLRHVAPDGSITTLATGLIDASPVDPPDRRGPPTTINRLYGLTVGADGVIHVAYQAGRRVIRIDADGAKSVAYRSVRPWAPLGVATRGEELYVLESGVEPRSGEYGLRVRRVGADGAISTIVVVPR